MNHSRLRRYHRQAGFTLIEMMLAVLILVIVMTAVFRQIDSVQRNSKVESLKLDMTQENRGFIDQFARDVHMSGYPKGPIYQVGVTCPTCKPQPTDATVAVGLVAASPTSLRFEGDVYGTGTVMSVLYSYFQVDPTGQDPNCPCIRRSVTPKQAGNPVTGQAVPVFYTEVQSIIDPTGMNQPIFTYYRANIDPANGVTNNRIDVGAGIDINNDPGNLLQLIDAIKVNLNTRSKQTDPQSGQKLVTSIVGMAELEN